MIRHLFTHAVSLSGALVFLWLNLPLPWLFGPMFSCLIAALCGAQLVTVKLLSDGMRTILGRGRGGNGDSCLSGIFARHDRHTADCPCHGCG